MFSLVMFSLAKLNKLEYVKWLVFRKSAKRLLNEFLLTQTCAL